MEITGYYKRGDRIMIKAKHNHIQDYDWDSGMQERLFVVMIYLWKKEKCKCGTPHRNIGNPEHRKLMEDNNWGPANKGPRWWYNFDGNALHVTYWCHGCKKTSRTRLRHTDQWIVDGSYKLFKEHNPEFLPELFEVVEDA